MDKHINDILMAQFKQLNTQMRIEFIHNCLYEVGCVDINTAKSALPFDRRTIYQQMGSGKLPKIVIGRHKFPCISFTII